jgi:hypothetical protein
MTASRVTATALILVIAATGLAAVWSIARASAGMDFYQMWIGGRMARETSNFYSPETRARMGEKYLEEAVAAKSPRHIAVARYRRNLEVLSTPFLYTLYAPFRGSYEPSLLVFQLVVLAAFAAWVAIFTAVFRFDAVSALALLAALLVAFEPVRSDARVANMNHIMVLLLAIAAALTARRKFALAGAVLALATLTKPYVIVTLPLTWMFWIAARRHRDFVQHAAGALVAGVAGLAVSALWFRDARIWFEWLAAFRAMPESMVPLGIGNIALSVIVQELTGFAPSIVLLAIAFGAAAFVAFRFVPDERTDVALIALGCVLFQLGSPLVWVHHLLLSVPLVAYLLRPGERWRQIAGAAAFILLAVEPWAGLFPDMIQVAAWINCGLLIAFIATLRDFILQRRSHEASATPSVN